MAQPLPATPPLRIRQNLVALSAYRTCMRVEKSLREGNVDNGRNAEKDLIYVRILGYLLHYVVSDRGLATVISEIFSAGDDIALIEAGKVYYTHHIRAFRSAKGPTPVPSNHPTRPSFDSIADMIRDTLKKVSRSNRNAKKLALIRDGRRCVVTGKYNVNMAEDDQELGSLVTSNPTLKTCPTHLAHIFDDSTNHNIELGSRKRDYAASMWAVISRFGFENLPEALSGNKIHRLENVMTLATDFHILFDRLKIWFVATNELNTYKLASAKPFHLSLYPEYVTFTTPDQGRYPVPHPSLLAIHAACAMIANLSGAV